MSVAAASAPARKSRAAGLSIASNATLIVLKVLAGTLTGSIAVLTEAVHSSIDLVASLVAYVSVRKAGEPADASHRYGHDKFENLAAAIEGMLILVGSAVIVIEAVRKLISGAHVHTIGIGIAVVGFSAVWNLAVSATIARSARATESAALAGDAAHLRTDAYTSLGVLVGLVLVRVTGAAWLDPAVALMVGAAIVIAGLRILRSSSRALVDEALPQSELDAVRAVLERSGPRGVAGYHKLRSRLAGARRYVDVHVQFRGGMTLEDAHATAHQLQDEIAGALGGADVLIHLEPADRVRPGTEVRADPPSEG